MGTINYKTSDYITIGYNLNYVDYEDEFYNDIINDYYDQVKYTLEKQRFYYFNVELVPGYYEGFSIDIEFNYKYCFDNWQDKRDAQKEITQLKKFLLECINDFECCDVWPRAPISYLPSTPSWMASTSIKSCAAAAFWCAISPPLVSGTTTASPSAQWSRCKSLLK